MKKNHLTRLLFLAGSFMLCVMLFSCENDNQFNDPNSLNDVAYQFPVKPGSIEWQSFTTHQEMREACQIPQSIINNLTTKALIETCLNYPLLGDFVAFDYLEEGYSTIKNGFNGISELAKREDAGKELKAYYTAMSNDLAENEKRFFQFMFAELVLMEQSIQDQFSKEDKKELLAIFLDNFAKMSESGENFSLYRLSSQTAVVSSTLKGLQVNIKKNSTDNGTSILSPSYIEYIYNTANNYLSSQANSDVTKKRINKKDYNSSVTTPNGSSVSVRVYTSEPLTSSQISDTDNYFINSYPSATFVSSSTGKYNCHSYAWYSQSSWNNKWMNYPHAYWQDGSYSRVYYCKSGTRWTYINNSGSVIHSAIENYSYGKQLVSKWGKAPLMSHGYNYSPYEVDTSEKRTYD